MEECNMTRINQALSPGRKVLGDINHLARCEDRGNPISPTANLKLLTKVASNFEKEGATAAGIRRVDDPIKKELQQYNVQEQPDENFKSRKDKSLGSLCSKFLQLFPLKLSPGEQMMISLDQAVSDLGTERRRIYDIINVLESLQMARKVAKNCYVWYGCQYLPITLALLKGLAVWRRLQNQVQFLQPKQNSDLVCVVADNSDGKIMDTLPSNMELHNMGLNEGAVQTPDALDPSHCTPSQLIHLDGANAESWVWNKMGESSQSNATAVLDSCAERSLGVMCQKFIMLFLISSKSELVNLDLAASVLLTENVMEKTVAVEGDTLQCCHKSGHDRRSESVGTKAGRFKTTVRRLYDIANVLTSLGLICKEQSTENSGRKPAFKYIGPSVEAALFTDQDVRLLQATRHSLLGGTPYIKLRKSLLSREAQRETEQHDAGSCRTFSRTESKNWSGPSKRKVHRQSVGDSGSLSDIFHVAEMELKRLEYQEMSSCRKSARKKLFPRHHSETCVVPSHQAQAVSGTGDTDLHRGMNEVSLDKHISTVCTDMRHENMFSGSEESGTWERPLKVKKIRLLQKSKSFSLPVLGKEINVKPKLAKIESLLSKKENHISLMREINHSGIENNRTASNAVTEVESPLSADQIGFTTLTDATAPTLPHFKTSVQPVHSSCVTETDGLSEASSADVGSSVPKALFIGKGVTVIETKLPALIHCNTVSSNTSGNVIASAVGNSILVPSHPGLPQQLSSPLGYVYEVGTRGSASGSVLGGNIYQAVQVGSLVQLVPLCNKSLSLNKQ